MNFIVIFFSQAPATTLSLAGELYGNLDFKKISSDETLLVNKKKLPNIFSDISDYYTFGSYSTFNNEDEKIIHNYINDLDTNETLEKIKLSETSLEIYRYSMSQYGTRILVNYFDNFKFYFIKNIFK